MQARSSRACAALPLAALCLALSPANSSGQPVDDPLAKLKIEVHDDSLPVVVAVVATGGSIAEKTDPATGAAVPAESGSDLIAAVPGLGDLANIGVLDFSDIDSSHMTPEIWLDLSRTVDRVLARPDVDGVVVTHGTDTMAEGAYFLDLTLESDKPVVFTGAMNAGSESNSDGPGNVRDAIAQVLSPHGRDWGVTVTLNRYVNSPRYVRKTQTTNVQAFESGEKGYLGYVYHGQVSRLNDRVNRQHLPRPDSLPRVIYLATYAGDDGSLVRHAVADGAPGLVIDALGAGNVNADVAAALEEAIDAGVAVVVSTRVYSGAVEPSYGDLGGGEDLLKHGAILGGYRDGPKARILLMLALANYGNDREKLAELFAN